MKKTIFLVLLGLLSSVGMVWGADISDYASGIEENATTNYDKGECGSISVSTNSPRTGSYCLSTVYTGGTGYKRWYPKATFSVPTGSYFHVIGYAKLKSDDATAESTSTQAYADAYVGTAKAGTAVNLTTSWKRITSTSGKASSDKTGATARLYRKHAGKKEVLFDDIVAYVSTSSTIDLTAPGQATSAEATETEITWTKGTDSGTGATGVQETLIWKKKSGEEDLSLNNQGIYSKTSTKGPSVDQNNNWDLVAVIDGDDESYGGEFTSGDVYAIVHRDLAYNYSEPTYVTIIDESADPEVTAVTINGEAISASDLATLTAEKEVTIDGSTMNGLGNIVLTMSKGDAPTITRTISSGVATYTYTLNAEEYTININYGERDFGDAEGSVVYYSKNSTTAAGVGTSSLTANDINLAYPSKTFGYGEGRVIIGSDVYQPIKLSTGEAVTVSFPSGKKATKVIVYGWSTAGNGWLKTLSETSEANFIFNNVAAGSADLFYATNEATDIYPSVYEYDLTNYGGPWEGAYFHGAATSGQPFVVMDFVFANAPVITTQPASASYVKNAAATDLSVAAISSDANDCTYQWYSCSDANKTGAAAIGGETTSSLSISTATTGIKYYFCRVTDGNGSTDSEVATINVTNVAIQTIFSMAYSSGSLSSVTINTEVNLDSYYTINNGSAYVGNMHASDNTKAQISKNKGVYFGGNDAYVKIALSTSLKTGDEIQFVNSGTNRQICFTTAKSRSTTYQTSSGKYICGSDFNDVSTIYIWRAESGETYLTSLSITRPTTHTLTVSDAGWATLYLDFPAKVPTGLTGAYYVSGVENGALTLEDINGGEVIPAYTGILVNADAANYVFTGSTDAPISIETNLLHGELDGDNKTIGTGKHYHLSYDLDGGDPDYSTIGFYYGAEGGVPFVISQPNKAYLVVPASSPAPARFLLEDEENNATNIKSVEDNADVVKFIENGQLLIKKEGVVYDALGRKIR